MPNSLPKKLTIVHDNFESIIGVATEIPNGINIKKIINAISPSDEEKSVMNKMVDAYNKSC